ncbi:hypothetical protein IEQ34_017899 [Dendrobium chrysotoxum]|uniref:Uncharacterized protein n=1 Tax=Dendrobium chrysotoxum TaxID=161865 RepID=A0AAV7GCZ1_DENCH|nr:hypothetical protein IEQ34_017899 [Dendrobium chrysotoxum]
MELLDYGVLVAALTNFPFLGSGGGDSAHKFQMDDDDSSFDLSDYFLADVNPPATPAQPELPAAVPMAPSSEQNLVPPAVTENNIRQIPYLVL